MNELTRYDVMCRAIAEAYEIDEVKDIRDKAIAWEIYSRQAKNIENERRACEIRLRAERKAGQLLKQMIERGERAGTGNPQWSHDATIRRLADLGISKTQSSRWQRLADVSEERFEAALVRGDIPTTAGILEAEQPKVTSPPNEALWLWGTLCDFERDGILQHDPNDIVEKMLNHMQETTKTLAPIVAQWLGRINP